jgi:ubiquitin C-terminal hydrolase
MEGLRNLGATCAINSTIQLFCRIDDLRSLILNNDFEKNTLGNELKEILSLMHYEKKSLSPNKFINFFYSTFSSYISPGEQLDISELFFLILNRISEELSVSIEKNNNIKSINEEHNECIAKFNDYKKSIVYEKTQGSIINIIECNSCNNKTYNFEPFTLLNLDIINEESPSIASMLLDYLKVEEREIDDWKCEKCTVKSNYKKTRKLWNVPDLIFININRFINIPIKNMNNINIDNNLIFKKGSIYNSNEDMIYEIKGIALHHGNSQLGGHYTCICKYNTKYYHYDDEAVNELTEEVFNQHIHNNNMAYIIIYQLRK